MSYFSIYATSYNLCYCYSTDKGKTNYIEQVEITKASKASMPLKDGNNSADLLIESIDLINTWRLRIEEVRSQAALGGPISHTDQQQLWYLHRYWE